MNFDYLVNLNLFRTFYFVATSSTAHRLTHPLHHGNPLPHTKPEYLSGQRQSRAMPGAGQQRPHRTLLLLQKVLPKVGGHLQPLSGAAVHPR